MCCVRRIPCLRKKLDPKQGQGRKGGGSTIQRGCLRYRAYWEREPFACKIGFSTYDYLTELSSCTHYAPVTAFQPVFLFLESTDTNSELDSQEWDKPDNVEASYSLQLVAIATMNDNTLCRKASRSKICRVFSQTFTRCTSVTLDEFRDAMSPLCCS